MKYQEYAKESEQYYEKIIGRQIIKQSQLFDDAYRRGDIQFLINGISKMEEYLFQKHSDIQQMQIYYDIAGAYSDLSNITNSDDYIDKEILNYRRVLDVYDNKYSQYLIDDNTKKSQEQFIAEYIAMRTYNNLGNVMSNIGRYINAIDCFYCALSISEDFAMASLNMAYTLFNYAPTPIDLLRTQYYHHACYYYYQKAKQARANLEDSSYLIHFEQHILCKLEMLYPPKFFNSPQPDVPIELQGKKDALYRRKMHHFFLDLCCDFRFDIGFSTDSLQLPLTVVSAEDREYIGLFNQMKQEYMTARYILYLIDKQNCPGNCFTDNHMHFVDIGDGADYSFKEELLRTSYRGVYSILDRIGYFLNHYFDVGLKEREINFKNIWKTELRGKKVPNPLMSQINNIGIKSLFWLQKDFFEDDKTNITNPYAKKMYQLRNDMEHNCVRTIEIGEQWPTNSMFTVYTSIVETSLNVERLLLLIREALFYLCLAVYHANREVS